MGEFLAELLSEILGEALGSEKVPKLIRIGLLTLVVGLLMYMGIAVGLGSPMPLGRIFGFALAAAAVAAEIYFIYKLFRKK